MPRHNHNIKRKGAGSNTGNAGHFASTQRNDVDLDASEHLDSPKARRYGSVPEEADNLIAREAQARKALEGTGFTCDMRVFDGPCGEEEQALVYDENPSAFSHPDPNKVAEAQAAVDEFSESGYVSYESAHAHERRVAAEAVDDATDPDEKLLARAKVTMLDISEAHDRRRLERGPRAESYFKAKFGDDMEPRDVLLPGALQDRHVREVNSGHCGVMSPEVKDTDIKYAILRVKESLPDAPQTWDEADALYEDIAMEANARSRAWHKVDAIEGDGEAADAERHEVAVRLGLLGSTGDSATDEQSREDMNQHVFRAH